MSTKIFLADLIHTYSPDVSAAKPEVKKTVCNSLVAPYGIASIAAYTKKVFGDAVNISLFKFANELLAAADAATPDVIAFSNYIWNSHLNLTIGTELRKRFPNALIIVGGPSMRTGEVGVRAYLQHNRFVDVCVLHEGERPFAEIIAAYQDSRKGFFAECRPINNAGYISDGHLIYSENDKPVELDEFPSPYLDGYLDDFISRGFIPLFETNRGCPFKCTYCAWGIASLSKVRKFPMERVFAELEYVSRNFPECSIWQIADANFGILPRDIAIAEKIRQLMNKNSALRSVIIFESKNTPERNLQIGKLLRNKDDQDGRQIDNALIALQTLDATAQKAAKRDNIKLGNVPESILRYHAEGYGVRTDLLSGLPGESRDGHMNTLRDVFTYDFDHIGIYNVVLLPGTEMETPSFRDAHRLSTKFRARNFGNYHGTRSVEAEEVVWENSAIAAEDLLTFRLVHWAIWYGWNHRFLSPILRYAFKISKMNPADVLYRLVRGEGTGNKCIQDFFISLRTEYSSEFFESAESLREFYLSDRGWNTLTTKGRPTGFIYNAKLINSRDLFTEMLSAVRDIVTAGADSALYDEICELLLLMRIEPESIYADDIAPEISVSISSDIARCFFPRTSGPSGKKYNLILKKAIEQQRKIRESLKASSYTDNPLLASLDTLDAIPNAFAYDFAIDSGRHY